MKKLLIIFFLIPLALSAQESKIRYYSYSEFFKMVENEPDSVFELKNAIIKFDPAVDQIHTLTGLTESSKKFYREDSIIITKEIHLENVGFSSWVDSMDDSYKRIGLYKIQFLKPLTVTNSILGGVDNCTFQERVRVEFDNNFSDFYREFQVLESNYDPNTWIENSVFNKGVFYFTDQSDLSDIQWGFTSCEVVTSPDSYYGSSFNVVNQENFWVTNTKFRGSGKLVFVRVSSTQMLDFDKNTFENTPLRIVLADEGTINDLNFSENQFDSRVRLSLGFLNENNTIDWDQFTYGIFNESSFGSWFGYLYYYPEFDSLASFKPDPEPESSRNLQYYLDTVRIENPKAYRGEMKLMGKLHALYKQQHDTEFANGVYVEMKNLETSRLAYLYRINPSFKTYFTWKVNQFLKIFSAYGTEPARAIIFSVYVILAFALVYLFFPNSWDAHGKNRIMNRYRFFTKYMNREAGMHEVYLEEQQSELLEAEDFKRYMLQAERQIPRFFIATAMPLYKWAISGSRVSAAMLKRVDIMKGTWSELPAHQRFWKSILLIGAFTLAIVYDLFIKVLNALMLSINTFTTLGFGEIPIKGLPRYLAIIQGFIGWFMLTIFSVSLISQLLN